MMIVKQQIKAGMQFASQHNVDKLGPCLIDTMIRFEINTVPRITAFLAQVAHESGSLRYVQEIASGAAYEGRKDLGNTQPGDGVRFKGRGLIQVTGRANYKAVSDFFKVDFVTNPYLLETPQYACLSAGWYWHKHNLNSLADLNTEESFKMITKKINGGLNGYANRLGHWKSFKQILE